MLRYGSGHAAESRTDQPRWYVLESLEEEGLATVAETVGDEEADLVYARIIHG